MIRVGVNGYGNIGKRVAYAIQKQPDMTLAGVTKATPDYTAHDVVRKGIPLYAVSDPSLFKGMPVKGTLKDLLNVCDVIVDCAPAAIGKQNKELYAQFPNLKVIFQGGEDASIADVSFSAQANYDQAKGKRSARVVSCNTTSLSRILATLDQAFGVTKARTAIVRRSADSNQNAKAPLNSWMPTAKFPSHHSPDVQTVLPHIRISSLAGVAPTTQMHGHMFFIECKRKPASAQAVLDVLSPNNRILIISAAHGLHSTSHIKDMAHEQGRPLSDIYEACVWKEGVGLDQDGEIGMHLAIDQKAVVIPETIDCIRAIAGTASKEESIKLTDSTLGIGLLRL